jgi:hypothetical protein
LARRRFREPEEHALDHPAARHDDEALGVVDPLVGLHVRPLHLCQGSVDLPGIIAAISPDQSEPR